MYESASVGPGLSMPLPVAWGRLNILGLGAEGLGIALCGVCLAEVMSTSAASPASCVPWTVSSGCRGPTGWRPGVST